MALDILLRPADAAEWSASRRRKGARIGFVPTMGALHAGHVALVRSARSLCDAVAVSIFVNPLQFTDPEDLARYPRDPEGDRRLLLEAGCDMVLMPEPGMLFADFAPVQYDLGGLDLIFEGASRPGHFQGVVNVVERLFHHVRPDVAFFGEKDRQQLAVIRQTAQRLKWPVDIVAEPTVRAADGLALSSRNQRLSPAQRQEAATLHRALRAIAECAFEHTVPEAVKAGGAVLNEVPSITLAYLTVAHPETLRPLEEWGDLQEAVALIAAQVGAVRLIDNITLHR